MILTVIGPVADDLITPLTPVLQAIFNAHVETAAALQLPPFAYSRSRDQYLSTTLLDVLARQKQPDWDRLLGITDVDLYVPDLNFVFGEADVRRGVALFSVARLHTPDLDKFIHRTATEAIHELGHTFGLTHCEDARCVMWFSNTLAETDRKGTGFCATHMRALQQAIERARP
jgi:archaemetzincin